MSRIYLAKTKSARELILNRAEEKRKWLRKIEAFGKKHGELDKSKDLPCWRHFNEITIRGFFFKEDPGRLWKKDKKHGFYTPSKSTKEGKKIYEEFWSIAKFDFREIEKKLNLDAQFTGHSMLGACFFYCLKRKTAGLSVNTAWKWPEDQPPKGFKEVTWSEYEKALGLKPEKAVS